MGNIVIILILAVIVVLAVISGIKHFKGQGGCCGGCGEQCQRKRLNAPKTGERRVVIEGMHCEHCKNTVESELNRIDGLAARVNLKTNTALIELSREVTDGEITAAVERAGFSVKEIGR